MFGPHRSARTVLAWRRGTAPFYCNNCKSHAARAPALQPASPAMADKALCCLLRPHPHEIKALPHEPILNDVCFSEQAAPGMFTAVGFC